MRLKKAKKPRYNSTTYSVLVVMASILLTGCVQQQRFGEYYSVSTLNYRGETLTHTQNEHWSEHTQQPPQISGYISSDGRHAVSIEAAPTPPPVNVIVIPARQPCQHTPPNDAYIQRGVILPGITPCY